MTHPSDRPGQLLRLASALFLPLLLLLFLAAPVRAATTRVEATGAGGYRGLLEFASAPLLTMRPTPFTLTLFAPGGQPTSAPELTCDLLMPAMPMPENRPQLRAQGAQYTGEAIFTMAGAWQVLVAIHRDGTEVDSLRFDLVRVLLK